MVTEGSWPKWLTENGPVDVRDSGDRLEWHETPLRSTARSSSDIAYGSRLELGRDLQDHLILIVGRVDL